VWLTAELPETGDETAGSNPQLQNLLIKVKDRGRGIPSDKLESIFGRFEQVYPSDAHQKGGYGLGLAICRSIIEQYGGRIWVESSLGGGSTFYFTLPDLPPNYPEFYEGSERAIDLAAR